METTTKDITRLESELAAVREKCRPIWRGWGYEETQKLANRAAWLGR